MICEQDRKCRCVVCIENFVENCARSDGINERSTYYNNVKDIGETGLRVKHNRGLFKGILDFTLEVDSCEHCGYGKHIRVRFPYRATRSNKII